jgi:hypothetical protein
MALTRRAGVISPPQSRSPCTHSVYCTRAPGTSNEPACGVCRPPHCHGPCYSSVLHSPTISWSEQSAHGPAAKAQCSALLTNRHASAQRHSCQASFPMPELKQTRSLLFAAAATGIRIHVEVEVEFGEILEGEGEQEAKIRNAIAIITRYQPKGSDPAAEVF